MTLECVPAFALHATESALPLAEVLAGVADTPEVLVKMAAAAHACARPDAAQRLADLVEATAR